MRKTIILVAGLLLLAIALRAQSWFGAASWQPAAQMHWDDPAKLKWTPPANLVWKAGDLVCSVPQINFGDVALGSSATVQVQCTNTGQTPIVVEGVVVSNSAPLVAKR